MVNSPALALAKTCPVDMIAGVQASYTLTLSNNGTAAANNVTLSDALPAGVPIVANPDGGAVNGSTVTWAIASLAPGASATLNLTVETPNP